MSESVLVAILSFVLSMLLVELSLPWFNQVAAKEMAVLWNNPLFWLAAIGFALFTGILAGSYPALYLFFVQSGKSIERHYPGWPLRSRTPQSTGYFSIYRLHYPHHGYYHCLRADTIC